MLSYREGPIIIFLIVATGRSRRLVALNRLDQKSQTPVPMAVKLETAARRI